MRERVVWWSLPQACLCEAGFAILHCRTSALVAESVRLVKAHAVTNMHKTTVKQGLNFADMYDCKTVTCEKGSFEGNKTFLP